MKSINDRKSHLLATARTNDDLKERLETDVVVSASFAAIIALGIAMGAGLYSWSRHAPVFLHSSAAVPAIVETIPWQA
jgi:hypothetical protein